MARYTIIKQTLVIVCRAVLLLIRETFQRQLRGWRNCRLFREKSIQDPQSEEDQTWITADFPPHDTRILRLHSTLCNIFLIFCFDSFVRKLKKIMREKSLPLCHIDFFIARARMRKKDDEKLGEKRKRKIIENEWKFYTPANPSRGSGSTGSVCGVWSADEKRKERNSDEFWRWESLVFKLSEEYREVKSTLALSLRDGCKLYTHRLHVSCVQREPMFLCVLFFLLILATLVRENFGELRVFLVFFSFSRVRQQIFLFHLHAFSLSHAELWIRPAVTADSLTLLIENYRVWCKEGDEWCARICLIKYIDTWQFAKQQSPFLLN